MAQDIIDQLSSLVSEFITRTTAKVRKDFREILITILILHISLPGRINFTQMGRFSNKSERTYRNRFECEYDWGKMNMELAKNMINRSKQKRLAVVVDASFLGKAGKKTPHVGLFWSGVNQAVKHGIELHSWAIVDADSRVTILFALCIEAGIFMLIAHWWGMTAAITVIAIECVLALWTVYEMRHASDEPVDE